MCSDQQTAAAAVMKAKGGNQDMSDTLSLPFKSFALVGGKGHRYLLHLYSVAHICGEVLRVTCCANQCTNADSRLHCVFLETESPCPPHLIVSLCYTSRPQYRWPDFLCAVNVHTLYFTFVRMLPFALFPVLVNLE